MWLVNSDLVFDCFAGLAEYGFFRFVLVFTVNGIPAHCLNSKNDTANSNHIKYNNILLTSGSFESVSECKDQAIYLFYCLFFSQHN